MTAEDSFKLPRKRLFIRSFRSRMVSSLIVGATVALLTFHAGWMEASSSPLWGSRNATVQTLGRIHSLLEIHEEQGEAAPASIQELQTLWRWTSQSESELPQDDGWGLPLLFEFTGSEVDVVSLGRDGEPGGTSSSYDLRLSELADDYQFPYRWYPNPAEACLSPFDFVFEGYADEVILWAMFSGLGAFLLSFYLLRFEGNLALFSVIMVWIFAAMLASFLALLHVPVVTGH